jgi:transcriptional regulator with XRE-family HTH domain
MAPERRRPRRRTAKEHGPDPVDVYVGRQMRRARELAGLTQVEVGKRLAMSFQVIQKYEQGEIRASASRLYHLARLFEKPVAFFFAGLSAEEAPMAEGEEFERRDLELIRAFRAIASADVQQRLLLLVRGLIERQERDAAAREEPGSGAKG